MKWGRKTSSPPSFGSSVITRVFPASWFSKFKQTASSLDTGAGKKQQRGKLDFSTVNSPTLPGGRQARFYSLKDDAYWTLSFRKDRGGEGRRRGRPARINPLWYDSDDEFLVAVSGFREMQLPRTELEAIAEIDTNEMKQEGCSGNILRGRKHNQLKKESTNARRSTRLRGRVERRRRRKKKKAEFRTGLDQAENESFPTELQETDTEDSAYSNSTSDATSERVSTFKGQNLESKKIKEFKVKTEEFRKESAYINRRFRSRKVKQKRKKAHGSRSECRVQALEVDGIKSKKEREEEARESLTIYNSFAVVKSSFDPEQDFRDSMVEMIKAKGIRRREELQELLASYLTLNCDGHHDIIINVFQQVWFELSCFEE